MHLHLPKPLHGWREFFGEIVIIVVGVLIALGAEQLLEDFHSHRQVAEMERRLKGEIELNMVSAYERMSINACLRGRIVELRDLLAKANGQWKGNPATFGGHYYEDSFPSVYRTPNRAWVTDEWRAASSSGTLTKEEPKLAARFSSIYSLIGAMQAIQEHEFADTALLGDLAFDSALTPQDRRASLRALATINNDNARMINDAEFLIGEGRSMGIAMVAKDKAQMLAVQRDYRGACVREVPLPKA